MIVYRMYIIILKRKMFHVQRKIPSSTRWRVTALTVQLNPLREIGIFLLLVSSQTRDQQVSLDGDSQLKS